MSEPAATFVRRIGRELRDFSSQKGRELSGRVAEGTDKVITSAEDKAYRVALGVVAKRFNLTPEDAESRLSSTKYRQRGI